MPATGSPLDELVHQISAEVRGLGPERASNQVRRDILNAKKSFGTGVDDICARIISSVHATPKSSSHRTGLMDEILSLHAWYRLHRGLMWQKIEGAARYAPVAAQFKRLETTIRRCSGGDRVSAGVSNHLLGMLRAAFEDYEAAAALFGQETFNQSTFMSGFYNGSSTFQPPSAAWQGLHETAAPLEAFFTVQRIYETQQSSRPGPLCVFSADANYFNGLAGDMLNSLLESSTEVDIDIVVIASPELVDATASELVARLDHHGASGRIIVVDSNFDTRTMSAVARYLWAGEQLRENRRSCAIFDLDVHFTATAFKELKLIMEDSDLGLSYGVYGRAVAPWSTYLAGATFVRAGTLGEFFFDRFRWFVGRTLIAGQGQWFIDQNAIFAAEYLTSRLFPAAKRSNLGGLLNSILANLQTDRVTAVKRSSTG